VCLKSRHGPVLIHSPLRPVAPSLLGTTGQQILTLVSIVPGFGRNGERSLVAHEGIPRLRADVGLIGEKSVYAQLKEVVHFASQIAVRRLVGA
jgi:hypothetical protein